MNYRLEVEKKEDFSRILPKGTFLSDYALNPGGFPQFFHFSPGQAGEKIASLQNQPFPHRQALVEYLRDYHQNLDAPPETLRNIDSLNDPQTLVVMTGQQPGLLTGPMYTIYKTLSCLWEAQRIEQTFGRRCIPIFWIASEDHNLEEATSIFWPAPEDSRSEGRSEGDGYSMLSIRPRRGHFKQPVGLLPLNLEEKKLCAFMLKLEDMLSLTAATTAAAATTATTSTSTTTTTYSHEVEHIVQSTLQSTLTRSATLAEWFSRLMLTFFGPCGLVLFEPNDARVKRLAGPLWEKTVADPLALPKIVDQAGQELERCGYLRQLSSLSSLSHSSPSSPSSPSFPSSPSSSSPGRCPFFLYENQHSDQSIPERVPRKQGADERMEMEQVTGDRMALNRVALDRVTREGVMWDGRLFRTRNQDYSPAQLQELLQLQPERFSPNVYLRPIFSESLFPTLCYLAGPGEIGYFAQIKGVYEYFGLRMPIILPRFSATLRDARKSDSSLLQDAYPQERKLNIFYLLNLYGPDFLKAIQSLKIKDYFVHYQIEIKLES